MLWSACTTCTYPVVSVHLQSKITVFQKVKAKSSDCFSTRFDNIYYRTVIDMWQCL